MLLPVVLLIAAAFCVACGKNGGTENATPTDKLWTEWHQLVKPVTNEDYPGIIAKSREIRERLFPKKEIPPLGSGRSKEEANGEPYVFGDSNAKSLTEIDLHTDLPLTGWNDADVLLPILESERVWKNRYNGMYDDSALEKINTRIATVVDGMADPSFYPEVDGLVSILKERGLPRNDVVEYDFYNDNGILSVVVNRTWSWYEWKESDEYADEDVAYIESRWPIGDFRFWFSIGTFSGTDRSLRIIQFEIKETVGLTFDVTTGEELRLSDLFPAGEDYLSYLNTQISARLSQEYDQGIPFSGLRGDETFYLSENYEDGTVGICFPGILQGKGESIQVPLPGIEETGRE